jgi:hypothetical protein
MSKARPFKKEKLYNYINNHEVIYRKDLECLSYSSLDYAIYKYAKINNIYLKRIDYNTWKKVKKPIDFEQIRGLPYKRSLCEGRKPTPKRITLQEREDVFYLTWDEYSKKYPFRFKEFYDRWGAKIADEK